MAKVNAGADLMKLSLIFRRTKKPKSIKTLNPIAANNNSKGVKYNPISKPPAPNN